MRIFITALFSVLLLKKQIKSVQWLALLILTIGVSLVQVKENKTKDTSSLIENVRVIMKVIPRTIRTMLAFLKERIPAVFLDFSTNYTSGDGLKTYYVTNVVSALVPLLNVGTVPQHSCNENMGLLHLQNSR